MKFNRLIFINWGGVEFCENMFNFAPRKTNQPLSPTVQTQLQQTAKCSLLLFSDKAFTKYRF